MYLIHYSNSLLLKLNIGIPHLLCSAFFTLQILHFLQTEGLLQPYMAVGTIFFFFSQQHLLTSCLHVMFW